MCSVGSYLLLLCLGAAATAAPLAIDVVPVATAPPFATFQSHNQKVVANSKGIFLTYYVAKKPDTWRLVRSVDGGRTFKTVYESNTEKTRAPAMETDEKNHIYLTHPASDHRKTRFLRFTESNGYTGPDIAKTCDAAGSASKYAMAYDRPRGRFYHATQWGVFMAIDKSGSLRGKRELFRGGGPTGSGPAYPHLFVDAAGVVHYALTTADRHGKIPYETIRYLKSTDGARTWRTMVGKPIKTPTSCEPNGPATMVNLPDEVKESTWLAVMHVKDGKVHFAYRAGTHRRRHYMRFDGRTGKREIDRADWKGKKIRLLGGDSALFASNPRIRRGPLVAVSRGHDGRVAALISRDNGSSWQDYATSSTKFSSIYALGGCRQITADGKVIGTFSGVQSGGGWKIYFFQIKIK